MDDSDIGSLPVISADDCPFVRVPLSLDSGTELGLLSSSELLQPDINIALTIITSKNFFMFSSIL